jgi:hypothetical protein
MGTMTEEQPPTLSYRPTPGSIWGIAQCDICYDEMREVAIFITEDGTNLRVCKSCLERALHLFSS